MPELAEIRNLLNFGMCVLLWLVQLVIYPSFLRVRADVFVSWHKTYTFRVAFVIIPMMFGQLGLLALESFQAPTIHSLSSLVLVLFCWVWTFAVSVPLHNKMDKGDESIETIQSLISTNWPRTIAWSGIFLIGLIGMTRT